jgi:hypothetical protein
MAKSYTLKKTELRKSISAKASNSWVGSKKKFEVNGDIHRGQKSAFHSLRIFHFGLQIAKYGEIVDYKRGMKELLEDIKQFDEWVDLKKKYQPVFNYLHSEFKKLTTRNIMKSVYIERPFKRWKNKAFCLQAYLSKPSLRSLMLNIGFFTYNYWFKIQFDFFGLFEFYFQLSRRCDHAGFLFDITVLGAASHFNIYDCRHWDEEKEKWQEKNKLNKVESYNNG